MNLSESAHFAGFFRSASPVSNACSISHAVEYFLVDFFSNILLVLFSSLLVVGLFCVVVC